MKEVNINYLPETTKQAIRNELQLLLPKFEASDSATASGAFGRTKYEVSGDTVKITVPIYNKKYEIIIVNTTIDELKKWI
jgi:hypothetical protein